MIDPVHRDLWQAIAAEASWLGPLGLVGLISWAVWLSRWMLSRVYRPVTSTFRATVSLVVPVYREDPDVLFRCLGTWLAEEPDELILVVDRADEQILAGLAALHDKRVRVMAIDHQGKRSALADGIRLAKGEIVVLADSDTSWEPGLLHAVQMPFADPRVGGVGTRQSVYMRRSSRWRIVADWMVALRYLDIVPAMGLFGAVACLSGRTAAYRRSIILPLLPQLEDEYFLGRRCVSGDDGRLTWLVLNAGYRTVHQATARATSMFPDSLRAFVKQRVRWSRNSYRCYLTAIWNGWLWERPLITQITVLQILATPLSMAGALILLGLSLAGSHWVAGIISIGWLFGGRLVRGISHLREHPEDLRYLPLIAVVAICVALPIKLYALLTMNQQGWLTRSGDQIGGEAQTEASLLASPPRRGLEAEN
ncbi:MAG: glycosyltransferase [Chloroflexi bacterium]|nr:MAG: glycosyltransferase [Chloroflexota bacterium]